MTKEWDTHKRANGRNGGEGKKTDQIIKATMDSNNSIKDNGQQQIKVKLLSMTTTNQGLLSYCHTGLKTLL